MAASEHLNPQQFSPDQVGMLRANDFAGAIGDRGARSAFENRPPETWRPAHREAGGPLQHLDRFTEQVRKAGKIEEPVEVDAHDDYFKVINGHHRALAAHALGLPLPYKIGEDRRHGSQAEDEARTQQALSKVPTSWLRKG